MSLALFYLIVAAVLIGAELLIMQFSVFWLFFLGLGAALTSLICWFVPEISSSQALGVFFAASAAVTVLLWQPIKKWQMKPSPIAGHDAIGQRCTVLETVSQGSSGKVSWSGSEWAAELEDGGETLSIGDTAIIRKLEGIRLIVGH